jgi:hypothetical protein
MRKSQLQTKVLIILSVFILCSDIIFIIVNYRYSRESFDSDIHDWAVQTEQFFLLTLDSKALSMQQIATYIANNTDVQRLFLEGKLAFEKERHAGLNETMRAREELYRLVSPGWNQLISRYDVRQLQFHLGPGSTSFLRVHRPEKYGDNMDAVRHTVVDVNTKMANTRGFETGRTSSGIRGVVPVAIMTDSNSTIHIGALEAGTSFSEMLPCPCKVTLSASASLICSENA